LIISCHADTGFAAHRLSRRDGVVTGHLDNFAGVHAVMNAYFSGRLDREGVRIELTEGEEVDLAGARRVQATLDPQDWVVVVDVTGTPTDRAITIEKCGSPRVRAWVRESLQGLSWELHTGCPDPISDRDECDVYRLTQANVCFLGIPCTGGDYNAGEVSCRVESLAVASEALLRLADRFLQTVRTSTKSAGRR
jgi:hypothetical protein